MTHFNHEIYLRKENQSNWWIRNTPVPINRRIFFRLDAVKSPSMTKSLVAVLLIVLVAGEFIDEIDGLLRAGRDRIEVSRDAKGNEREAAEIRAHRLPIYFRRGEYVILVKIFLDLEVIHN